ncbi:MAG: hypothetical protein H7837_12180 [Magnetococcus sp. MYC-9]
MSIGFCMRALPVGFWVLLGLFVLYPVVDSAAAGGSVPVKIPASLPDHIFDYNEHRPRPPEHDALQQGGLIRLPREVDVFGDREKLKWLCVRFNGISLGLPEGWKEGETDRQVSSMWIKGLFERYFTAQDDVQGVQDACRDLPDQERRPVHVESFPKDDRRVLRMENGETRWVSLLKIKQFAECITFRYRQEADDTSQEDSLRKQCDLPAEDPPQAQTALNRYFLSRAFLPVQELCGVRLESVVDGQKAKMLRDMQSVLEQRCRVPELVRVELVEGHVGKLDVKMSRKPPQSIPVTVMRILQHDAGAEDLKPQHHSCEKDSEPADDPMAGHMCEIVKPIQGQEPLPREQLEQALMQLTDIPGTRNVQAVLSPPDASGQPSSPSDAHGRAPFRGDVADLFVQSDFKRYHWMSGLDNYGSQYMGPQLWWNRLDLHYALMPGDALAWTYVTTPRNDELLYHQVEYQTPLWRPDVYGRAGVVLDRANLGGSLAGLDIETKKQTVDAAAGYILFRDRDWRVTTEAGLLHTDIDSTLLGGPGFQDQVNKAFVLLHAKERKYVRDLGLPQEDPKLPGVREQGIALTAAQGFSWAGNSTTEQSATSSRPDAGPQFSKLNLNYSINRQFHRWKREPPPGKTWLDGLWLSLPNLAPFDLSRFFVTGRVNSQWSSEPLFSSEEVGFGGRMFGRAYSPGEISGDLGVGAELEAGLTYLLGVSGDNINQYDKKIKVDHALEVSGFGFLDGAHVWNLDTQDKLRGREEDGLSSAGVGFRAQFRPNFSEHHTLFPIQQISTDLSMAWPLGNAPRDEDVTRPVLRWSLVFQFEIPEK